MFKMCSICSKDTTVPYMVTEKSFFAMNKGDYWTVKTIQIDWYSAHQGFIWTSLYKLLNLGVKDWFEAQANLGYSPNFLKKYHLLQKRSKATQK